jgi:DNA-binding phage protein
MANNTAEITSATNRNILLGVVEKGITRNAVARKAGIPATTFNRKVDGNGDFTLSELGAIADALDKTLADILPVDMFAPRSAA